MISPVTQRAAFAQSAWGSCGTRQELFQSSSSPLFDKCKERAARNCRNNLQLLEKDALVFSAIAEFSAKLPDSPRIPSNRVPNLDAILRLSSWKRLLRFHAE